jgi:Mor family transcriptional regulator
MRKTLPRGSKEEKVRNARMAKEKEAGVSYNVLARKYDISPQRVWQLLHKKLKK